MAVLDPDEFLPYHEAGAPEPEDARRALQPECALALAVLRQAIVDTQGPRASVRGEARVWFAQRAHTFWLQVLGLPEEAFDQRLEGLRPDPADLPAPAPPPLPALEALRQRRVAPRAQPALAPSPPPAPPPPPPPPPPAPAPAAPGTLPARFPLGCSVRLSAVGADQLVRLSRNKTHYQRRATVVGYTRDLAFLKVQLAGQKSASVYAPSFWAVVPADDAG